MLRPHDEVRDDQEVSRELHSDDDVQLALDPSLVLVLVDLVRKLRKALLEALIGPVDQVRLQIAAVFRNEGRQHRLAQLELQIDHLHDAHRVVDGLLAAPEDRAHLLGRADIKRVVPQTPSGGILVLFTLLDRAQDIMRSGVRAHLVVAVVRRDQRHALGSGELFLRLVREVLRIDPGLLQLEEEVLLLKNIAIFLSDPPGSIHIPGGAGLADLSVATSAQTDQPLVPILEHLLIDPRDALEILALLVAHGDQVHQVRVADGVLRQKDQVMMLLLVAIKAILGDVDLHAQDRLHVHAPRAAIEVHRAEHVGVVRDSAGLHPQLRNPGAQLLHVDGAIQEAVGRVHVQVREVSHGANPPQTTS